jgi:hypothetical protein
VSGKKADLVQRLIDDEQSLLGGIAGASSKKHKQTAAGSVGKPDGTSSLSSARGAKVLDKGRMKDLVHERLCDPELERLFAAQENAQAKGPEEREAERLEKGGVHKEKAAAQKNNARGWVTWRENGRIVFAERQGAEGGGNEAEGGNESDDSEACEITAVTHVSDPVASFDLCEEQDQEDKEKQTAELLKSTKETLERLRKIEPDHEKLLVSLKMTEPGSLPRL